jgi:hypothetical protein
MKAFGNPTLSNRVRKARSAPVATKPPARRPWRIEPTPGDHPVVARPVETREELRDFLDMVKTMPEGTHAERERKTRALAVGLGMALSPSQERRGLLLVMATAAVALWPFAISFWLGTTRWPAVDWWYIVPGALLIFGGATIICDVIAGDFRGTAREFRGWLTAIPVGLWLLIVHPVLGANDPLTEYAVQPVIDWIESEDGPTGCTAERSLFGPLA